MFGGMIPAVQQFTQQPGGLQEMYNQLTKSGAEAKYAPYQQYANALLTNEQAKWLPYQYQLQTLPMLLMSSQGNPALQQQILQAISNPISTLNSNMPNIPAPGSSSGIFGKVGDIGNALLSKLGIGGNESNSSQGASNPIGNIPTTTSASNQSKNAMNNQPGTQSSQSKASSVSSGSYNPVLPSASGGTSAVVGNVTASYNKQVTTPGQLISNPNQPGTGVSTINDTNTTAAQQAILGITNLKPLLQSISDESPKFENNPGEKGKVKIGQIANLVQQYAGNLNGIPDAVKKSVGVSNKDITDYAEYQADKQKAVETYMKARNWPQDAESIKRVSDILQPIPGEPDYASRVSRELAQLEQQVLPNYQQALGQSFTVPTLPSSTGSSNQSSNSNAATFDPVKFANYKFKNDEELNSAFNSLNPQAQKMVVDEFTKRGWLKRKKNNG